MARGCTRSDASADYIITSNGLPADTAGLTVAGWVKVDASAVTNGGYMCADEVTGGVASFFIRWDVGFGLSLYPFLDDSFAVLTSITEEWLYISISCAGGGTDGMTCRVWDATGQLLVSVTRDLATRSLQKLSIANRIAVNASVLGEYAQWRVWDAALSQSELEAELASSTPVRTANLNRAFEDDPTVDVSGNDRPFGVSGIEVLSSDWPPNYPVTTGTSGGLVVGSETSFVGEGFVGSIEAAGELTSSITLTLTPAGALTGTGALVSNVGVTLTPAGALTGTGALACAVPLTLTPAGALTGTGALVSNVGVTLTPAGALTGTGALSASIAQTLSVAGTLTAVGDGAITSAIPLALSVTGTLTGTGALVSAIPLSVSATSTLTGRGALTSTLPLVMGATGTLTSVGSGAMTGTIGLSVAMTASLSGIGALTGAAPLTIAVSGTIVNGAPHDLVSALALAVDVQGALTGRGALTTAVPLTLAVSGALSTQISGVHPDRVIAVTVDDRTITLPISDRVIAVTVDDRTIN